MSRGFFMSVTKDKKAETLKKIKGEVEKAKIIIMVNFHGLNVALASELRRILNRVGTTYMVAKKTLVKKVLDESGVKGEMPKMEGEIAIAYSDESPEVPAKALQDFAKKHKDVIKLTGGIFENSYINGETVVMLANIPSREALLGQLVRMLSSPGRRLVVTLQGTISNFVNVLRQVKKEN